MFSSISHLVDLSGARVLDLYAGSGALGLEAASRGARHVVFVDSSKKVERLLKTNVARVTQALGDGHTFQVVTSPAAQYCQRIPPGESFDLVVIDPPYDAPADDITHCLQGLEAALTPDSLVVVERAKRDPAPQWPQPFEVIKHKTYGDTAVFYVVVRR